MVCGKMANQTCKLYTRFQAIFNSFNEVLSEKFLRKIFKKTEKFAPFYKVLLLCFETFEHIQNTKEEMGTIFLIFFSKNCFYFFDFENNETSKIEISDLENDSVYWLMKHIFT